MAVMQPASTSSTRPTIPGACQPCDCAVARVPEVSTSGPRVDRGAAKPSCERCLANEPRPSLPASTATATAASNCGEELEYAPAAPPRLGVGSNGSQPQPRNQTSTHVWASWSVTVHWPECLS